MGREKLQNFQKENSMPSLEFRVKFDIWKKAWSWKKKINERYLVNILKVYLPKFGELFSKNVKKKNPNGKPNMNPNYEDSEASRNNHFFKTNICQPLKDTVQWFSLDWHIS